MFGRRDLARERLLRRMRAAPRVGDAVVVRSYPGLGEGLWRCTATDIWPIAEMGDDDYVNLTCTPVLAEGIWVGTVAFHCTRTFAAWSEMLRRGYSLAEGRPVRR